jgi:hypothetical protein
MVMCTVHYILHLHCNLSLSRTYGSKGFCHFGVGTGTKEHESSIERVWAAAFHHVTARSRLARVLKRMHRLFL